jgi:hypothetical protein
LFQFAVPITILKVMPVIPKPPNAPPLFGGKTVILFGGYDKEAMRRWQERLRAAKNDSAETSIESVRANRDPAHGDNTDEPSESRTEGPSGGDNAAD